MSVRFYVRPRALLVALALLLLPVMAFAVTFGGTPSVDGDVGTLTFDDVTVTMSTTTVVGGADRADYGVIGSPAEMDQRDGSGWGGTGDYAIAGDPVYTPSGIADGAGLSVLWRSNGHPGFCDVTDMTEGQILSCPTPTTVTFAFSRPVSGVVLHLHNLGGVALNYSGGTVQVARSMYSKWTLTSGQEMELLSRGGNIRLSSDGRTIEPREPSGTGLADLQGVWQALNLAPQPDRDYFGTGSGSFKVNGSFSTLTFNVDLFLFAPLVDSLGIALNAPEGVGVQFSFLTYSVAFDLGGGTGTTPADITGLDEGDVSTLPGDSGFSRDGFTFDGWDCDQDVGTVQGGGSLTQPAADVLCTALWTPVSADTYSVAFDLGGGTGTTPADITGLDEGDVSTLPGDSGFSRDGFTFDGWDCDQDVGTVQGGGSLTQPPADVLCTAAWTRSTVPSRVPAGEGPPVRLEALLLALFGGIVLVWLAGRSVPAPRAPASWRRAAAG